MTGSEREGQHQQTTDGRNAFHHDDTPWKRFGVVCVRARRCAGRMYFDFTFLRGQMLYLRGMTIMLRVSLLFLRETTYFVVRSVLRSHAAKLGPNHNQQA